LTLTSDATFTANFILVRAGRITGVVQAASSEEPLAQMTVAAYNEDGSRRGLVTTGAGGGYTLVLPPGNYRVVAYDDTAVYAVQFFRDKGDFESADLVPVTSGATTGAVDFRLPRSARASGSVVDALSGAPLSRHHDLRLRQLRACARFDDDLAAGRILLCRPPGSVPARSIRSVRALRDQLSSAGRARSKTRPSSHRFLSSTYPACSLR
jgi:hypothetical protein